MGWFPFDKLSEKMKNSPIQLESDLSMRVSITPGLSYCLGVFGLSYTAFNILVVSLTSIFVTIPDVFSESPAKITFSVFLYIFVVANIIANFLLFSKNRSFHDGGTSVSQLGASLLPTTAWSHCPSCGHQKPPRTHHCILCRRCVLKRDHHCFFVGSCVGFYNQRYFVFFCFYSFVGAVYGCYLAVHCLRISFGVDVFTGQFFRCSFPIATFDWLLGNITFSTLAMIMFANLCCVTSMGAGGFAFFQFYIIALGVTLNEFKRGERTYRTRLAEHFRSVFGPYWLLNFIFPMPVLKNMGDGVQWESETKLK